MTNIKPGLRALLATAVMVAALAIPAQSAIAASNCSNGATASQYCQVKGVNTGSNGNNGSNGNGPTTEAAVAEGATPTVTTAAVGTESVQSSGSTLPFTGLDVGILAIIAAALVGVGLVLRRMTATGEPRS